MQRETQEKGVDLILDPVGGAYLGKNLQALAENGGLGHIGLVGGADARVNMGLLLGKSLKIIGSRLRSRPLSEKIDLTRQREQAGASLSFSRWITRPGRYDRPTRRCTRCV